MNEDYKQVQNRITVGSVKIDYFAAIPASYTGNESVPLILALHYGGEVTPYYALDFMNILVLPALKDLNALIIAPNNPFNDGWATQSAEYALMALMDSVQADFNIDTSKVLVTGFSMGAVGTWHMAAGQQEFFKAAIPVAGMPPSYVISLLKDVPMYVIHSKNDEVFPFNEAEEVINSLITNGIDIEFKAIEGLSHYSTSSFVNPLHEAIPWVLEKWQ
jgi:predicted peptidase